MNFILRQQKWLMLIMIMVWCVFVNVVDLMNTLVENFAEVLNEVSQLQKVRELNINVQCLQQEHDTFNIENFRLLERVGSASRLLFRIWCCCFACITWLVIDNHLQLEHFGIIAGKRTEALCFPLFPFIIGFSLELEYYLVRAHIIIQISGFKKDGINRIRLCLVINLQVAYAEFDIL